MLTQHGTTPRTPGGDASRRGRALQRGATALAILLASQLGAACGGGGSGGGGGSTTPGGLDVSSVTFQFTDPNNGGTEQEVRLSNVFIGRLVQVFGVDGNGSRVLMSDGYVIEPDLVSVSGLYEFETNPVTGQGTLTILGADVTDTTPGGGYDQFLARLQQTSNTLVAVSPRDVGQTGVFTMVPRNAALVLQFDDLIDPRTIDQTTIRLSAGYPPNTPFEARIFADVHFGGFADLDGRPGEEFYPTRVIVDPTINEIEAFTVSPPLPINTTGLPASVDANRANILMSFPTEVVPAQGQNRVISNPTGHRLTTNQNGPVHFSDPLEPVVRAFRAGGNPDTVSDPFNGFLQDLAGPQVVGSNPVEITMAPLPVTGQPRSFVVPAMDFASQLCAQRPLEGDVISQGGVIAIVLDNSATLSGTLAENVLVSLLQFPESLVNAQGEIEWPSVAVGQAFFETAYEPATDGGREACFLRVSPRPTGYPENPTEGIATNATFRVRFSEAMDPTSLTAFDSLTLTRTPVPAQGIPSTDQFVIGRVGQSADLRDFTFQPDLPLNHVQGSAESYFLALAEGQFAPKDLAGNDVNAFTQVEAVVEVNQGQQLNGGRVSRFVSIDEEFPIAGPAEAILPEWGGQFLLDPGRQLIRPRPVVRQQVFVDRDQPTLQGQTPFSLGIVTPLSNFGSKMQILWRYADCGFALPDPTAINIDVEGLGWAPAGGSVVADAFSEFEIRLSHSRWAPDEVINPSSLFPQWPSSGLVPQFANNVLPNTAQEVVHPREDGYILNPADVIVAPSGTRIVPFPLNRDVPLEERRFYTWRDTSIRERSGSQNGGVDPDFYLIALGITPPQPNLKYYPPTEAQTIGLPLLMEFRTYRDDEALGVNGFDINLAANSSSRPYFRAFSTGGIRQNGQAEYIDPDTETSANGGFNPGSSPPGQSTWGQDNAVYLGALDFVVRISRAHSVWFRSAIIGEPTTGVFSRNYNEPTLEPRAEDQPVGTRIDVDYRGAQEIEYFVNAPTPLPPGVPGISGPWIDNDGGDNNPADPNDPTGMTILTDYQINAFQIDLYGDYYNEVDPADIVHRRIHANPGLTFLLGDSTWKSDLAQIANARFYQVRLTFVSNAATMLSPELSAFAIAWTR